MFRRRRVTALAEPVKLELSDTDRKLLCRVLENDNANRGLLREVLTGRGGAGAVDELDVNLSPWTVLPLWGRVVRVTGMLAVIVAAGSLAFVAYQTMQSAEAAKISRDAVLASAFSGSMSALLDFDRMLVDDRGQEAQRYLLEGEPLPMGPGSTSRRRAFEGIALAQLDLLDGYDALARLEQTQDYFDQAAINRWVRKTFERSPELCRLLSRERDTYPDEFVDTAKDACTAGTIW